VQIRDFINIKEASHKIGSFMEEKRKYQSLKRNSPDYVELPSGYLRKS
jgi:hypothetical protein